MKGLEKRSRAPKKVSNRTSEEVERLIVSEKRQLRQTQCVKMRVQFLRFLDLKACLMQLNINNLCLTPLTCAFWIQARY